MQKKSGFMNFMFEYKKRNGLQHYPMSKLTELSGEIWSKMSASERHPYVVQARNASNLSSTVEVKIESDNETRSELTDIKREIGELIEMNLLSVHDFYFIHMNNFCFATSTRLHYPAEVAVVQLSLLDGIKNVFHEVMKPGLLPLGYANVGKVNSTETHKLPIPADDENNIIEVLNKVKSFTSKAQVVYVLEKQMKFINAVLNESNVHLNLRSLEKFFSALQSAVSTNPFNPGLELQSDIYDFIDDIACDFHKNTEVPMHCSRSTVIRFAYIIFGNSCKDLNIEMIPGLHAPSINTDIFVPDKSYEIVFNDLRNLSIEETVSIDRNENKSKATNTGNLDEFKNRRDLQQLKSILAARGRRNKQLH